MSNDNNNTRAPMLGESTKSEPIPEAQPGEIDKLQSALARMQPKPPREWTLQAECGGCGRIDEGPELSTEDYPDMETVKVVEKSAYDALVAERAELRAQIHNPDDWVSRREADALLQSNLKMLTEEITRLKTERDKLRAQNAALVERLRQMLADEYMTYDDTGILDGLPYDEEKERAYVTAELAKLGVRE